MRAESALDRGDADGASRRGTRPSVLKEPSGGCSPRAGDRHASTVASCCWRSELKAEQEWESGSGTATFTGRSTRERNPIRLKRGDGTGGSHPLTYLCDALLPTLAPWTGQSSIRARH